MTAAWTVAGRGLKMRAMTIRLALAVLCLVGLAQPAAAQIAGPPNVFTTGTTIVASEVNANFATVYTNALNRTGGTMTGALVFSADNTHDIGASGTTRPRDLFLGRNATIGGTLSVTGAVTLSGAASVNNTLTVTSTTAPQFAARYDGSNRLDVSIGSTGAATFNAVGAGQAFTFSDAVTVPAFASTSTGTISGTWTFTAAPTVSGTGPRILYHETDATADEGKWWTVASADTWQLQTLNDAESVSASVFSVSRTGTTVEAFDVAAAQLRAVAGSVGTPSISFTGDPDTGIYSVGANTLGISAGGSTLVSIAASGVTIGSTRISLLGALSPNELAFASLPGSPNDGDIHFCNNCTIANPCASGGTGALAKRLNGVWVCN